jgi:hypothetical protein
VAYPSDLAVSPQGETPTQRVAHHRVVPTSRRDFFPQNRPETGGRISQFQVSGFRLQVSGLSFSAFQLLPLSRAVTISQESGRRAAGERANTNPRIARIARMTALPARDGTPGNRITGGRRPPLQVLFFAQSAQFAD